MGRRPLRAPLAPLPEPKSVDSASIGVIKTPDGEDGLNYLCAGYKSFFMHIDKPMKTMARLIQQGRYADEIMQVSNVT